MRHRFILASLSLLVLAGCTDTPSDEPPPVADPNHFTLDTPIAELAANSQAAAVLRKDIPGLLEDASYPMFQSMSLRLVGSLSRGQLSKQTLSQTEADLRAVPHAATAMK